ncbi:hypothetical protein J5U22_00176 [Saccharolobus shibatae]|uniref:Uncharacterized protein n=1 Tax=Saccharolobus shibatae TaxID=2286 RepID=A0A8F5BY47_9CREN|nr:hypothetical protein J5U21_00246 [Saccharolobus shibatae]QXJ33634.1 hypothetical protein J5U22_00176 [Saccharolobus shibatae]
MRFNDEFLLMGYTTSKLKNFTAFRIRVVGVGSMVNLILGLRSVILWKGGLISLGTSRLDWLI